MLEPILKKIAAQVNSGPCVTYIGAGGAGNYVKMIHNGIEYGDMQVRPRFTCALCVGFALTLACLCCAVLCYGVV